MKTTQSFFILVLVLVSTLAVPAARADELDQASKITFNQPVQIPGHVLPAGTYWFVLADVASSQNVVHIFNSDRSVIYTTILTIASERPGPTEKAAMTLSDGGTMRPETIVSWFYPGRTTGHQFVYSRSEQLELAQHPQRTIHIG
jgi:hypothetical protein